VDDGSKSLEDSLAMLAMAAEAGTTDIVATPHADLEYKFQPELNTKLIEELTKATLGKPRIHHGCDFHLAFDNIQDALANPTKYTINNRRYLLVEFSELQIFPSSSEIFGHFKDCGIIPIITHPERNSLLQQRLEQLETWVAGGCYLQVTAGAVMGQFGSKAKAFSEELFKRGLVHFLASDAHDTKHRTTRLDGVFEFVRKNYGERHALALLEENPRAVLVGDPLPFAGPEDLPAAKRKWYQFW
jgi:protein-tyrosine phosphatase